MYPRTVFYSWTPPHQGSNKANLAHFAQRMVQVVMPSKAVDTDPKLLRALKAGSEILQEISDNFTPLIRRFCAYFFSEQEKTNLGVTLDYVRPFLSRACCYSVLSWPLHIQEQGISIINSFRLFFVCLT